MDSETWNSRLQSFIPIQINLENNEPITESDSGARIIVCFAKFIAIRIIT